MYISGLTLFLALVIRRVVRIFHICYLLLHITNIAQLGLILKLGKVRSQREELKAAQVAANINIVIILNF